MLVFSLPQILFSCFLVVFVLAPPVESSFSCRLLPPVCLLVLFGAPGCCVLPFEFPAFCLLPSLLWAAAAVFFLFIHDVDFLVVGKKMMPLIHALHLRVSRKGA